MSTVATPPLFPVTYSVLSADALVGELAEWYDIGAPRSCALLQRGLNATYVVYSDRKRYVARAYGAGRSQADIAYELDLLVHLAANAVPVCVPIPDRQGSLVRPLAAPEGVRQLVLFSYAEGTPISWQTPEHCRKAGRLVAQFHDAADSFESDQARVPLDLDYLIGGSIEALHRVLDDRRAIREYLGRFATNLWEGAKRACARGLDWGVCHGDLAAGNIHAFEDRLTIFDFDLAAPGWRAYDLASVQWVALNHRDEEVWDEFIRGYTDQRALGAADLAAVPIFHAIRHLWSLGLEARCAPALGVWRLADEYLDAELSFFRECERTHRFERDRRR